MRRILHETRQNPPRPSHFVYIMRILFRNKYGIFRQLTCPAYGITAEMFRDECRKREDILKALSMLRLEGPTLFATLSANVMDSGFQAKVLEEIQLINSGMGEDFVTDLLNWVRVVQLRAMQEFAVCHPQEFEEAWTTTDPKLWRELYSKWRHQLRVREERDIGWILCASVTPTTPVVCELRLKLQETISEMAKTLQEDDETRWEDSSQDIRLSGVARCQEPVLDDLGTARSNLVTDMCEVHPTECDPIHKQANVETDDMADIVTEGDTGIQEETAGEDIAELGSPNPIACAAESQRKQESIPSVTDCVTLTDENESVVLAVVTMSADVGDCSVSPDAEHMALCKLDLAHVTPDSSQFITNPTVNSQLPEIDITETDDCGQEATANSILDQKDIDDLDREKGNVITSVVAELPSTGISTTHAVFPEIESILHEDNVSPGAAPLLTLSQFNNSAHAGHDVVVENDTFSQDPSFHQWIRGDVQKHVHTPYKGVSIVAGQDSGHLVFADEATTCRNLAQSFEEEEELEAVSQLVNLSQAAERDTNVGLWKKPVMRSRNYAKGEASRKGTDSSTELCLIQVGEIGVMTLAQAYAHLRIEDLLRKLPGREGKKEPADGVVFFNESHKELEVRFCNIRDLKRVRTRLGNDVVDFVMSQMYYQYPARSRHEIHFVTSQISSCFRTVAKGRTSLKKWASVFLQPPSPVRNHQVKEIFLPWVTADHWSLLVFQYHRVLHFDPFPDSELHDPGGKHADFVKAISQAWQTIRGVELYDVPVVQQIVLHQKGNYECGHHTLYNAMLYLKVRNTLFFAVII